ncbi:MAG: DSD1 family PLP-dependent enzyme [Alphaproteobacteria bacterium]
MTQDLGPNAGLIGAADARTRLNTPALILDLDAFEANIARMADYARAHGMNLRPHAKSHKCVAVARAQVAAGALGVCCATMGEMEAMAAAGIPGLLLTSPVTTPAKIGRLVALAASGTDMMAVIDDARMVAPLDQAAAAAGTRLRLVIDLDIGLDRTGCAPGDAVMIAHAIADAGTLDFVGVQAYAGHHQHIVDIGARRAATVASGKVLADTVAALTQAGMAPGIVTGAGTGTFDMASELKVYGELQVGSYPFMDVDYLAVDYGPDGPPFRPSLFVATSVISAARNGGATTDAGIKAFATDGPKPVPARGAPAGSTYVFQGDEHGRVVLPAGAPAMEPGAMVECINPHCDPTINLHSWVHCMRGERLEAIWPIDARGR